MLLYKESRYQFVGYFSKEKSSTSKNNLSCILILPIYQKNGLGKLLIELSKYFFFEYTTPSSPRFNNNNKFPLRGYHLFTKSNKIGSPEKPLSQSGLISYRKYWLEKISRLLLKHDSISISQIKSLTGIAVDDILDTLKHYSMLHLTPHGNYTIVLYPLSPSTSSEFQFFPERVRLSPSFLCHIHPLLPMKDSLQQVSSCGINLDRSLFIDKSNLSK